MTPETVCPDCEGTGRLQYVVNAKPECPTCFGTGRIPAQGSETPKSPAEAEQGKQVPVESSISPTPPSAGEGELDRLIASKEWLYDCTAYGEGQQCCVEAGHPNRARLDTYIARRVLEELEWARIQKPIGRWAYLDDRIEHYQRIAVIKKESQQ